MTRGRTVLAWTAAALVLCVFGCDRPGRKGHARGERVVVEMSGGGRIEGALVKKDDAHLYLYVGDDVIAVDHKKVKAITSAGGEAEIEDVKKKKLYYTAKRSKKSVQAFVEEMGPAIVVVKTPGGMGTGWFCNTDGYLITNNHVVAGERSITVTMFRKGAEGFGKKIFKKVRIIALNDDIDLALLKVEEEIDIEYPQLYIGDSTALNVGDAVFAIGNPMGLERSTSQGEVSKASRNMAGRLYVQTTAPIAPGNSGGPLFNERGEVVGIVNMGYIMLDGLGFAIPSKYVKEFLDNVEAFAYDEDNPNSGMQYMETPITATDNSFAFTACDFVKAGHGISCLTLADVNADGVEEIVFANNRKAEIGVIRLRKPGEVEKELVADFEDINKLPESERFKIVTTTVASKITSIAVADMNGDGRSDIVFLGDLDGLAVLEQKDDGTFRSARKIDDVKPAQRRTALRLVDIDGDGRKDVFVLGKDEFTIFKGASDRKEFPLNASYKSRIKSFELTDVNKDGKIDIVFFAVDKHYAAHVRFQNDDGEFVEEYPIRSQLSGPVRRYTAGEGLRFLALDKGLNRVRELTLAVEKRPGVPGEVQGSLLAMPVDAGAMSATDVELGDIDGDGRLEMLACDGKSNEFVVYTHGKAGFRPVRSPSPKAVTECRLYVGPGPKVVRPVERPRGSRRAVAFSFSSADKMFGVSRIEEGKVSFPRPINTEGQVQSMKLEKAFGGAAHLVWIEKVGSKYFVRYAPADALLAKAYAGGKGSLDVAAKTFSFGPSEKKLEQALRKKPNDLAFADFNSDGMADLVVYWSYSGKESLYVGLGGGAFREIIKDQKVLEEQKGQPLIVEDIDADGRKDVLLVKPGFVRVLKVDEKGKLYVERQFNWKFDEVKRLTLYENTPQGPRFVAIAGRQAKIVELDTAKGEFTTLGRLDLSGIDVGRIKVGDVDGNGRPDILILAKGAINIFRNRPERWSRISRPVFNAKLDNFTYWDLRTADLDGDGADEVMLFDSKKAMFEVYRPGKEGELRVILRQRLFEKTIFQRQSGDSYQLPQELKVGDVDGNGKADFVCILQDRVAIYLQDAK